MSQPEDQKEVIAVSFGVFDKAKEESQLKQAVLDVIAKDKRAVNLHGHILAVVEEAMIREVLRITHGNQIRTAQILGLNRNTLRKKMYDFAIEPRYRRRREETIRGG